MGRAEDIRRRWEFCTRSQTGPEHQPVSDIKHLLARIARLEAALRDTRDAVHQALAARSDIEEKIDSELHNPLLEAERVLNKALKETNDE